MDKETIVKITILTTVGVIMLLFFLVTKEVELKEEHRLNNISVTNLETGDFVKWNGSWYPIKQIGKEKKDVFITIRTFDREVKTFYGTSLNDIDSIISIHDGNKWIDIARNYLIYH